MADLSWLPEVAPVALTLLGGSIGWFLKDRVEASRTREQRLHEERARLYTEILEPVLAPFTERDASTAARLVSKMTTPEYRRNAFQLAMLGSDPVVKSWNDFMQYMYHTDHDKAGVHPSTAIRRLGRVLLEIRRSVGSPDTKLTELDMLKWFIKDIEVIEDDSSHV